MNKKLYRSVNDKKIAGVCAGVAEYFGWDPTMVRLVWALAVVCASVGFWAYIVCALVIPEKPDDIIDAE
jgi:phage shock protein C